MTKKDAIEYQEREAKRARKALDEVIERSIKELEELKNFETYKVVRYLECTMERLENARKFAEDKDKELNFLNSVFNAMNEE